MWEYLAVLLIGFWLGVAIFLYISCYWLEEILDLPPRNASPSASSRHPSSASSAHVQLKRLVARVVEEAASMPALARYATEPSHTPSIESSTYEDLLASAILNKVIERYQNENGSGGRSSGIHSASASPTPSERSSPRSLNSRHTRDITPPLHEEEDVSDWDEGEATDEALEVPRRVPFPEFGEDIVHQSVTENEDRDFDEVSGSDLQAVDGTWEENWLFQKKKIKTVQSVPVPMLVPNSNTEYRALIGDRDADDTTDLSDNASDADEDAEYKSDIKRVLDSKHIIGGKTKINDPLDMEPDSLTIIENAKEFEKLVEDEYKENEKAMDKVINEINDNNVTIVETINVNTSDKVDSGQESILILGIEDGPLPKAEFAMNEEIHRTGLNGDINGYADVKTNGEVCNGSAGSLPEKVLSNTLSHHERESEYEETVTRPVQRYADSLRRKHFEDTPAENPPQDEEEELIPGSIAYRERKKWLNCVEMPNNPYSPEAIKKRLSAKSTSSIFDMITKNKDMEDNIEIDEVTDNETVDSLETPMREINHNNLSMTLSTENVNRIDRRSQSPSPKILKDVLADEVPQYKRYGRDYYIREAKASSGGRKKGSFSDTSSISSMNKSTSLDNFDTEFASPVSASSSLSDLEASALHQNIVRAVLSPRNASPNFAINPIFENPDRPCDNGDDPAPLRRLGRAHNGLLIKQFNMIATNQQYTKFAKDQPIDTVTIMNNQNDIMIEYEDSSEQTLFSAKPAFVDDDTDKKFDEILQSAYTTTIDCGSEKTEELKSPISVDNSYISSSSLEDTIKIYNVQTGEIVKCKPEDKLSTRYDADRSDNNDNDDKSIFRDDSPSPIRDDDEETLTEKEARLVSSELDDVLPHLPKVKELAKKFVSMENLNEPVKIPQPYSKRRRSKENILNDIDKPVSKPIYMHSLTARSISKEFREELKLSMATPLTVPGGSKEIPEGIEEVTKESSRPGSPLPEPGTIKSKLAFFESLKSKFSNSK
ncbi:uncharacterized protein LOC115440786 isoform X3 [Manduca sexta]|uniref:uncharacterized protein LOC115440786 isoform X3 n=1 Tax=Manduca sexta TaxID=7130 RepID=UPI00188F45F7|nr:uncharacterized protein LOC115440786 isoform X3 [Manduca sexta]XP_030021105.2 uncharacterized protein LOC115440786 isoform X3 [Manduca sexta]XP_030021106.2 uncharacterized protein LOC115440786 isoform X3 [Manduca sexta]